MMQWFCDTCVTHHCQIESRCTLLENALICNIWHNAWIMVSAASNTLQSCKTVSRLHNVTIVYVASRQPCLALPPVPPA